IPIIKKTDYQNSGFKLISDSIKKKDLYTGYTSGSSGHPFSYAKDKFAHAMTWALIKNRYDNFGLTLYSKQARFYGIPFERKDYIIERTKDYLANRYRFPVFDMSDEKLETFFEKFTKTKFDYIYGYTNSIVLFARYLIKKNIVLKDVCPTLKICICTSENCAEEDKEIIKKGFGITGVNEYGTSEVDLIAFEDFKGNWKLSNENIYIEILGESGGKLTGGGEGRIILTALHNKAMPFIRYEIGDTAVIEPSDSKIIIKKLLGGVNDIIQLPSGKKSSGITFYFISRGVLERSGNLREFIIKQIEINKFVFEVVSDEDISEKDKAELQKKMDIYLEPGLNIEINRVEKIERTKAGKMKHFHSLLK
ncbi:MAG: phenylacetate--CoA ligase family protein, partial [Ignavibacteria bacterium]|nr:phenylacetate--CoA ligase family protein [Ignavibacteria bacterium]